MPQLNLQKRSQRDPLRTSHPKSQRSHFILSDRTQPSHVIMSYELYQYLLEGCAELEDAVWVKSAIEA